MPRFHWSLVSQVKLATLKLQLPVFSVSLLLGVLCAIHMHVSKIQVKLWS